MRFLSSEIQLAGKKRGAIGFRPLTGPVLFAKRNCQLDPLIYLHSFMLIPKIYSPKQFPKLHKIEPCDEQTFETYLYLLILHPRYLSLCAQNSICSVVNYDFSQPTTSHGAIC